jgi:integrase
VKLRRSIATDAPVPEANHLPTITPHGLRHSHGTHRLEAGWPVHVVAARLGHDPATLLRVYAHADNASQDRIEVVEALLDGTTPPPVVLDSVDDDAAEAVLDDDEAADGALP